MSQDNIIGVIGGMGPYAGLDLVRKIFDRTVGPRDQDHPSVALLSFPERIRDRSTFLFEGTGENPGEAIARIALQLDQIGAVTAGIPCNTAHAPAIFDLVRERLREAGSRMKLVHMIEETVASIRRDTEGIERIGILSTLAVYRLGLYRKTLAAHGFEPILPDTNVQENIVNRTIFDPSYGIKAQANPVSGIARQSLMSAIEHLHEKGAQAIILGCTELPLAIPEEEIDSIVIIDPTDVLAQVLLRESNAD